MFFPSESLSDRNMHFYIYRSDIHVVSDLTVTYLIFFDTNFDFIKFFMVQLIRYWVYKYFIKYQISRHAIKVKR